MACLKYFGVGRQVSFDFMQRVYLALLQKVDQRAGKLGISKTCNRSPWPAANEVAPRLSLRAIQCGLSIKGLLGLEPAAHGGLESLVEAKIY